jgi:hypothetical protein
MGSDLATSTRMNIPQNIGAFRLLNNWIINYIAGEDTVLVEDILDPVQVARTSDTSF